MPFSGLKSPTFIGPIPRALIRHSTACIAGLHTPIGQPSARFDHHGPQAFGFCARGLSRSLLQVGSAGHREAPRAPELLCHAAKGGEDMVEPIFACRALPPPARVPADDLLQVVRPAHILNVARICANLKRRRNTCRLVVKKSRQRIVSGRTVVAPAPALLPRRWELQEVAAAAHHHLEPPAQRVLHTCANRPPPTSTWRSLCRTPGQEKVWMDCRVGGVPARHWLGAPWSQTSTIVRLSSSSSAPQPRASSHA